ncbi:MAG: hypothetical protein LM549_07365, partial [Candidatus Competibacter sp.]|nr:hypothetical protein [Candidatus Competibacter sp.]
WLVGANGAVGFTNFDAAGTASLANIVSLADQVINGSSSTSTSTSTSSIDTTQVPSGIQIGVGDFTGKNQFGALISALAKDVDANVLSTPTVVTLDNEEAEIIVGQNVPFVTGTYTTSTTSSSTSTSGLQTGGPFQTIQRNDVGIKLKVKPQINEGNAVKLEISQEVSNVVPSANAATQGPTLNTRNIKTKVLVENGQILVLGGLIDETLNETAQKVPVLGDIPLLGNLFRYRNTDRLKRNLMVFLHPVILRDPVQSTLYTSDKYSYIREQQLAAREKGNDYLLPNVQPPVLKPEEEVKQQGTMLNIPPPAKPTPPPAASGDNAISSAPVVRSSPPAAEPAEFGFGNK